MKKAIALSFVILTLALVGTRDQLLAVMVAIIVYPAGLALTAIQFLLFRCWSRTQSYALLYSQVLNVVFMIWLWVYLSSWFQAPEIFKLVMHAPKTESVENFSFKSHGFTDEIIEVYFEINPTDLKRILESSGFEQDAYIPLHTIESSEISASGRSAPPILNATQYRYSHPSYGCTLFTNQEHNRVFLRYWAD